MIVVRWPLRLQIFLPMAGLVLVSVVAVTALNVFFSVRRARLRIEGQLRVVARTLSNRGFPRTSGALAQTTALSGAEFIVTDAADTVIATSRPDFRTVPHDWEVRPWDELTLGHPVQIGARRYFHAAVPLVRRSPDESPPVLHVFFPEESWRQALRDEITSPLLVGGGALVVAVLLAVAIASRVTRPLRQLGTEVDKIAHGKFRAVPLPGRNDELKDLAEAIDRMARQLAMYEQQVRRNERLRTLGQLGGGMAHQIRNAATGCRMALDLLARENPAAGGSEHLEVATRQLELMEEYLKRLLTLGRKPALPPQDLVDLTAVVEDALKLVAPTARHIRVAIEFPRPDRPMVVRGDYDALQQLLVNLLINAVDAAGSRRHDGAGGSDAPSGRSPALVSVDLSVRGEARFALLVADSGPGPSEDVGSTLFEPLVTDKPDGSGLGLTVAREIAEQHNATIRWERRNAMTCFVVEFPMAEEAAPRG
jgi:signal transduction histidine kinase